MSMIQVSNLSFTYEGSPQPVFTDVSFRFDSGWRLGFTGRNGRGKTTFLRLLMGQYEYSGKIISDVAFDYFPYVIGQPERDTIWIAGEVFPDYEYWQLVRELNKLQVDEEVLQRPFVSLSQGEQTKVMLALLFLKEGNFLLIDEPTNHLDRPGRALVAEYLKRKSGFVLVSHDRDFLDACVDHMLVINKTNIEVQKGNFSSWYENKQRADACEIQENQKLKKEIKRLQTAAKQAQGWADDVESQKIGMKNARTASEGKFIGTRSYLGEKSRRMQQRRKNLERRQNQAIEEKVGLLHNIEEAETLKLFPQVYHQERIVQLQDLSISYGHKVVLEHVALKVNRGECLNIQGGNGSGKSSLLKLILTLHAKAGGNPPPGGNLQPGINSQPTGPADSGFSWQGEAYLGKSLSISFVSQDTSGLRGGLKEYAAAYGVDLSLLLMLLRKLDFSREQLMLPMESFSEGQKKKVLIARSLCEKAHLYLWDEPLNFVDLYSRMQIEQLLLKYKPAMLLIEHDKAFTDKVSDRRVFIEHKSVVHFQ